MMYQIQMQSILKCIKSDIIWRSINYGTGKKNVSHKDCLSTPLMLSISYPYFSLKNSIKQLSSSRQHSGISSNTIWSGRKIIWKIYSTSDWQLKFTAATYDLSWNAIRLVSIYVEWYSVRPRKYLHPEQPQTQLQDSIF